MNIILLSGGSGKRLWPLSNEVRSKQFLKIFKRPDGTHESMVQRMYRMICDVDKHATVTIATSKNQVVSIKAQLDDAVSMSIEPSRRDTFPAIALAVAYLHDIQNISSDQAVVVCPVDPYVESDYFQMLEALHNQAQNSGTRLVLMGIEPTYPSTKYGYIIPSSKEQLTFANAFQEKPDESTAEQYIAQGALWNSGVFAFKLSYVLDIAEKTFGSSNYQWLYDHYSLLPKISFDYAVVEKEKNIQVMRFAGQWKDLGTWNTLTEAMSDEVAGNAIAVDCDHTHVINELQIPLIALGAKNLAIAATPDGILVTDKKKSSQLKDFVTDHRPMFEKCDWGEYQILNYQFYPDGNSFLTKHLLIVPGKQIPGQLHQHRAEIWTIVHGTGTLFLGNNVKALKLGDSVHILPGMKHAVKADTELHIIEVQIGEELSEEDYILCD